MAAEFVVRKCTVRGVFVWFAPISISYTDREKGKRKEARVEGGKSKRDGVRGAKHEA